MVVASYSKWPIWCFVNLALATARDCIVYQLDTDRVGREQIDGFTDPQGRVIEPFARGTDDCDAKARFFVALCLAVGVAAEMVPKWDGDRLAHVYARAYYAGPDGPNSVLPLEWHPIETILSRARQNEDFRTVPKENDTGQWKMS
jgi:hypothetical protein